MREPSMGRQFVILFQKGIENMTDTDRRQPGEETSPRTVVWNDETRALVASIVDAVYVQSERRSEERIMKALGVPPAEHAEQHEGLGELIPWIRAQRKKAENQAQFWDMVLRENFRRAVGLGFWFLIIALVIGASGAWRIMVPLFKP